MTMTGTSGTYFEGIAQALEKRIPSWLKQNRPVSIAPLVTFRVVFGLMLFVSSLRFVLKGWVADVYLDPVYFFSWSGFEWVKPLGPYGTYLLFAVIGLAGLAVAAGYRYRLSSVLLFLSFTYVELIDKTTYLNHYYFVSLVAFLLVFLPANRAYSLDALHGRVKRAAQVPGWAIGVLKFQLGLVYFFAGIAKLNHPWLFEALPMKIWLPAKSNVPLIGDLLNYEATAYLFSWAGALYDLSIPFLLYWSRSRPFAYFAVVAFHVTTAVLFPIGMFPWLMIGLSTIFLSPGIHEKLQRWIKALLKLPTELADTQSKEALQLAGSTLAQRFTLVFFAGFFALQLALPFRHLAHPGNVFWNEAGYRFSWRVMLMEKAGAVWFKVREIETGREWLSYPADFLSPQQEKMMATQPDMILQFAHFLEEQFHEEGFGQLEIKAESYVSLNGAPSQRYVDPDINLLDLKNSKNRHNWLVQQL